MNTKNSDVMKRGDERVERVDQKRQYATAVDIFENADELLLVADMPGVTLEEVNIHFEKNQLSLEGHCTCLPEEPEDPGFTYVRKFVMPGGVNADKISAELKKGVLTVHLPKHDSLRPRQIMVHAG